MERRSGIALWRQIADQIRLEVAQGVHEKTGKLPTEQELAGRFGVNRHTVREAIASLVHEGVLRSEQGRGTFIAARRRFAYPIGPRTRFSAGLEGQARDRRATLVGEGYEPATAWVAAALGLQPAARVLRLETLSEADGRPVSRATSWFDAARFSGLELAVAETGSITAALRRHGVADYLRRSTEISARHASAADLTDLRLSPGSIVLVTSSVNEDMTGAAIQVSETRFVADLVELTVGRAADLP